VAIGQHYPPSELFGILDRFLDMFIGMPWASHPRYFSILLTNVNTLLLTTLHRMACVE